MLDRWFMQHARMALMTTAALALLAALVPGLPMAAQLGILAVLVALLGLPHGAVDHWQGRDLLRPRLGKAWPVAFGVGYTAATIAVIAAWIAWPPLLLAGFLVLASAHFGSEDVAARSAMPGAPRPARLAEAGLRGGMAVLLPLTFHPGETAALFAALLPATDAASLRASLGFMTFIGPVYIAALGALVAAALVRGDRLVAAEIAALTATFAALPPLLAFTLYFCLWHSPRHSLLVIADAGYRDVRTGSRRFALAAAPLTLVTIAAAAGAWWLLAGPFTRPEATLQVVFIGLAALTVPHVILPLIGRRFAERRAVANA